MKIIVNRDIRDYKTKDIGPFTLGQAVAVAIAAILVYGVWYLEKYLFGFEEVSDMQIISSIIVAIPPLLFGFYRPFGCMSFKNYLLTVIVENIINPKVRKYGQSYEFDEIEPDETDLMTTPTKYTKEERQEIARWKGYK